MRSGESRTGHATTSLAPGPERRCHGLERSRWPKGMWRSRYALSGPGSSVAPSVLSERGLQRVLDSPRRGGLVINRWLAAAPLSPVGVGVVSGPTGTSWRLNWRNAADIVERLP